MKRDVQKRLFEEIGRYIDEGRSEIGGAGVAVNPSGGLMARGHPLGASGMAQIHEIVTQLRGQAGGRGVTDLLPGHFLHQVRARSSHATIPSWPQVVTR